MKKILFATILISFSSFSFGAKLDCELYCEGKNLNQELEGVYLSVEGRDEHEVMIRSISDCRRFDRNGRLYSDSSKLREITLGNIKNYCRKSR